MEEYPNFGELLENKSALNKSSKPHKYPALNKTSKSNKSSGTSRSPKENGYPGSSKFLKSNFENYPPASDRLTQDHIYNESSSVRSKIPLKTGSLNCQISNISQSKIQSESGLLKRPFDSDKSACKNVSKVSSKKLKTNFQDITSVESFDYKILKDSCSSPSQACSLDFENYPPASDRLTQGHIYNEKDSSIRPKIPLKTDSLNCQVSNISQNKNQSESDLLKRPFDSDKSESKNVSKVSSKKLKTNFQEITSAESFDYEILKDSCSSPSQACSSDSVINIPFSSNRSSHPGSPAISSDSQNDFEELSFFSTSNDAECSYLLVSDDDDDKCQFLSKSYTDWSNLNILDFLTKFKNLQLRESQKMEENIPEELIFETFNEATTIESPYQASALKAAEEITTLQVPDHSLALEVPQDTAVSESWSMIVPQRSRYQGTSSIYELDVSLPSQSMDIGANLDYSESNLYSKDMEKTD